MTGHPWYEDGGVVAARQLGMDVPHAGAVCTLRRGRRDAISANERKRVRLVKSKCAFSHAAWRTWAGLGGQFRWADRQSTYCFHPTGYECESEPSAGQILIYLLSDCSTGWHS